MLAAAQQLAAFDTVDKQVERHILVMWWDM